MNQTSSRYILIVLSYLIFSSCNDTTSSTPTSDAGNPDSGGEDTDQKVDSGPPPIDEILITDLAFEENPLNVLSCFVSWNTKTASTSTIEFAETGGPTYRITNEELTTKHSVFAFGMHASTTHSFRAISQDAAGDTGYKDATYTTGEPPFYIVTPTITVHDETRANAGWTLMTVSSGAPSGPGSGTDYEEAFYSSSIMYDMEGRPVWYNTRDIHKLGDTRYVDGHVITPPRNSSSSGVPKIIFATEIDLTGEPIWEGPVQDKQPLIKGHYHHHFEKLPNGNYLTLLEVFREFERNNDTIVVMGDEILELDPSLEIVWRWSTFDHLVPDFSSYEGEKIFDWTHCNSVAYVGGHVLLNARHTSTIYKIEKASGNIIWQLGENGDFAPDPNFEFPWPMRAHALDIQPNGNILVYDNGGTDRPHSRAMEMKIDEQAMSVEIVWGYNGSPDDTWFTGYWGDADRLENGNTLITAGQWTASDPTRVFEITSSGDKVWEMEFPPRGKYGIGVYNSQRLIPLLEEVR
jgi:arylsulfotransferase ASST